MKKSLLYIVAMLVLFALPIVFTSCSGSDSEDEDPAVDSKNTKIEVSFSGDYGKFSPVVSFYAYDLQGSGLSMQTPDGTKNTEWTNPMKIRLSVLRLLRFMIISVISTWPFSLLTLPV